MAISLDELEALLREIGIEHYEKHPEGSDIVFGIATEHYRRPDGEHAILLVAELSENGEYFRLFAPMAYRAAGEHGDALLKTCMIIQWMTKLIQFEYDSTDGEIRPIIEFPLEDGKLTAQQLGRCVGGLLQLMEQYDDELRAALDQGVVVDPSDAMLDQLHDLLTRMKRQRGGNGKAGNGAKPGGG
jgi:hypothetical protein